MRKLGFGFASIGMLMLVLTGVEPVDEMAFWIHAAMMWIGYGPRTRGGPNAQQIGSGFLYRVKV